MRLRILLFLRFLPIVGLLAPGFLHGAPVRTIAHLDVPTLKKLSLEELMSIEVTSVSLRAEKLASAASAIQVVTSEDIRRSGAAILPEALRLAGNLNISQKNAHDWAISARGFNANLGNKMLVLIDGRSVYTPLFAGVFWSAQDYLLEDIDQIEVISGPGGTLWGANAVNGVINVTTKNAADTQGTYLSAATGDELQRAFAVRYGGRLAPDVFFRVYAKYLGFDASTLASGQAAHDAWAQGQTGFRLDAKTPSSDQLTLRRFLQQRPRLHRRRSRPHRRRQRARPLDAHAGQRLRAQCPSLL